jgi:Asp-tRNA(Asn)/Glu-tRNA(Gln) amidotransferase A subunit family amidase
VAGLPVGISLIGRPGEDAALWQLAYGFEQATRARREPSYLADSAYRAPAG